MCCVHVPLSWKSLTVLWAQQLSRSGLVVLVFTSQHRWDWGPSERLKVVVTTDKACCRSRDNLIAPCKRSLKAERAIDVVGLLRTRVRRCRGLLQFAVGVYSYSSTSAPLAPRRAHGGCLSARSHTVALSDSLPWVFPLALPAVCHQSPCSVVAFVSGRCRTSARRAVIIGEPFSHYGVTFWNERYSYQYSGNVPRGL